MPATPLRDRLPGLGPLGFGGAPLGNLYAPIEEAEALGAVRAALEAGCRLFDTAPHYGQGLSERRFGAVLGQASRDSFVLMTKTGRLLEAEGSAAGTQDGFVGALGAAKHYDYSEAGTLRSLADSRARLGLARIDIALIHDIDVWTHGAAQPAMFAAAMQGATPALTRLREAGEIAAWGLGVNEVAPCRAALDQADPDLFLLAGRYTLLDQAGLGLLDACARRGVGIVIGGPFNSGILATGPVEGARYDYKPATEEVLARTARIEAACARHGVALAAAALRFTLCHPAVLAAIPGARSPAEVAANMALARTPIPAALWRDLKREGLLAEAAPEPPEQGA